MGRRGVPDGIARRKPNPPSTNLGTSQLDLSLTLKRPRSDLGLRIQLPLDGHSGMVLKVTGEKNE